MSRSLLYRYQKLFKWLFIIAIIAIYILAMLPQNQAPQLHWSDKVSHVFAFMVLGFLLRMGFRISYFHSLALLILYGAFIEASQYFTPDRSAEMADIGADAIGTFMGLKLYKYLRRLLR